MSRFTPCYPAAAVLITLSLFAAPAWADWEIGFADDTGSRITELHAAEGDPVVVHVAAFSFAPPEGLLVEQYEVSLFYNPEGLTFDEPYVDERGWTVTDIGTAPGLLLKSADSGGAGAAFDDTFILGAATFLPTGGGGGGEEEEGGEERRRRTPIFPPMRVCSTGRPGMTLPTATSWPCSSTAAARTSMPGRTSAASTTGTGRTTVIGAPAVLPAPATTRCSTPGMGTRFRSIQRPSAPRCRWETT
jgi:hypothetical protein